MDIEERAKARQEIYEKYKEIVKLDGDRIIYQTRANAIGQQITEERLSLGLMRATLEKGIVIGSVVSVEYIPVDKNGRAIGNTEHFQGTVIACSATTPISPIEIVLTVETRSGRKETRSIWTQIPEYTYIEVLPVSDDYGIQST